MFIRSDANIANDMLYDGDCLHVNCVLFLQMEGLCVCSMSCVRVVQFSCLSPQDGYLVSWLAGSKAQDVT